MQAKILSFEIKKQTDSIPCIKCGHKKQRKGFYFSVSPVREYQHPRCVAEEIDDTYCL